MFGSLFDESPEGLGNYVSMIQYLQPPKPRSDCKLAGIDNQGATCYLNSLLQTLLFTPEFKERLFNLSEEELGMLPDEEGKQTKLRVIPVELQRLFVCLLLGEQESVSTTDLTNSFGWNNNEEFQQHDVQELNRILFSAVEDSLIGTSGQNIIHELYHGLIVNKIACASCKNVSEREEDFLDLTVFLAQCPGLPEAFKRLYCEVELMTGNNKYRCEKCNKYTDATKSAQLRNLPPILTVSLLRFSYDFERNERYKENGRFTFPLELDMSPYTEECKNDAVSSQYQLFSVVIHKGGAHGGHYSAYIRDVDQLGEWNPPYIEYQKSQQNERANDLELIDCQSPIDLIQTILARSSHNAITISKLCEEISKTTGVSWNKRYKKKHGSIVKFLSNCDCFYFNPDTNYVSTSSGDRSVATAKNHDESTVISNSTSIGAGDGFMNNFRSQGKANEVNNWFCFNDSKVGPIFEKDIETQYSGKESAYMLFYRKKSLVRPPEANRNPSYGVSPNLMAYVAEINENLDQKRQEYDSLVNTVTVIVYNELDFKYDGQTLTKLTMADSGLTIELDKRKPISYLRQMVKEKLPSVPHSCIHQIKEKNGGYHIYEELIGEEQLLGETFLSSDSCVLVWNGETMKGEKIDVGEATEPIRLSVKIYPSGDLVEVDIGKHKTLTHLISLLENTPLLPDGFQVYLSENGVKKQLPLSKDGGISAFGLKEGSVLVIFPSDQTNQICDKDVPNNAGNVYTGKTELDMFADSSEWSLTLQNRLHSNESSFTCKTIEMKVNSSISVLELKSKAIEAMNATNVKLEQVLLRQEHPTFGLQTPLREGLSLSTSGLSNGSVVVLQDGRPPTESEMTISVSKVISGGVVSKKEFLVEQTLNISGMLDLACRDLQCQGTNWYLSKTDMYGEASDALSDLQTSLVENLVHDGDSLILQPGLPLKKDHVALSVWLAPKLGSDSEEYTQDKLDKLILMLSESTIEERENNSNKICELPPLDRSIFLNLVPAFNTPLCIHKSTSVLDVKEALMATQEFQALPVPTVHFLRLRTMEENRLKSVVRNNSQEIRHAKPKEELNIAVQILPEEENIGQHQMLLLVAVKVPGTRQYTPAREFVWNTSPGLTTSDLKKAVCNQLSLSANDVLLAKYFHRASQWLPLKNAPKNNNKNKNKKNTVRNYLKFPPYSLSDGDLIGIKIISGDIGLFKEDDFSTDEDLVRVEEMKKQSEEKRKMREEKKAEVTKPRRPETSLSIKVEKFS